MHTPLTTAEDLLPHASPSAGGTLAVRDPSFGAWAQLAALDERALRWVAATRSSASTFALRVVCRALDPDMVVFGIVALLLAGETLIAERLTIAIIVTSTLVVIVKRAVRRSRPDSLLLHAYAPPDKYSFPSGHTAAAFALALAMLPMFPMLSAVLLGGALLVAWGRMALGVHYPVDVAAGAAIGIFVGTFIAAL